MDLSATVRIVALDSPSGNEESTTLPVSQLAFAVGQTFYLELWAQTPEPAGFTQVSADIGFDPNVINVLSIAVTSLFSFGASGTIDNVSGLLDNVSGAHPPVIPACSDAVGTAPQWAKVATIEAATVAAGFGSVQTGPAGDGIHFVAICAELTEPAVDFGFVQLTIGSAIPAASAWGLAVMGLLVTVTATLCLRRRPHTWRGERQVLGRVEHQVGKGAQNGMEF